MMTGKGFSSSPALLLLVSLAHPKLVTAVYVGGAVALVDTGVLTHVGADEFFVADKCVIFCVYPSYSSKPSLMKLAFYLLFGLTLVWLV